MSATKLLREALGLANSGQHRAGLDLLSEALDSGGITADEGSRLARHAGAMASHLGQHALAASFYGDAQSLGDADPLLHLAMFEAYSEAGQMEVAEVCRNAFLELAAHSEDAELKELASAVKKPR